MSEQIAKKFIEALNELESGKNADNIAALFADDSKIGNSTLTESFSGTDGAQKFWTSYRKTFGEVKSTFKNKVISDNVSALEWTTTGTGTDGNEINYDGVSIIESDGDKITRFFAYFNPSELGHQIVEETAKSQEA